MATSPINPQNWNPLDSRKVGQATPTQIRDSARQFEALLIGQIMRSVREANGGWLGCGEDQAGSSMADYAEQQLAEVLSASGGLGLAALLEQGLRSHSQPQTLSGSTSAKPEEPK
jgi:peptidoglycan hydrolase FlgJ